MTDERGKGGLRDARDDARDGGTAGDDGTAGDVTIERVAAVVARARGLAELPQAHDLLDRDLGCTSFDMMVLMVEIETAFGVTVGVDLMAGVATVGDLRDAIEREVRRRAECEATGRDASRDGRSPGENADMPAPRGGAPG